MANYVVPEVGSKGTYTFKPPYDSLTNNQTELECMGVRKITNALAMGENVFAKYYKPYKLTQVDYENDLRGDVTLVDLQSALGSWVYVPNSYIASYPDPSGIRYRVIALAVDLGALPDTLPLEPLMDDLKAMIHQRLGVMPTIQPVAVSQPAMVSYADHKQLETARVSRVTVENSLQLKYNTLLAGNEELLRKNKVLSDYIISIQTP
jgi:hypothetical protein